MNKFTATEPRLHSSTFEQPHVSSGDYRGEGSRVAAVLLFVLILVISIGSRINIGFVDADIRIQDLLLFLLLLYLLLASRPAAKMPIFRLMGYLLPIFLWASVLTVTISIFMFPEVGLVRRITYYGRTIEMIVLAAVVAGLYLRAGKGALITAVNAVALGALLNITWTGFQIVTDTEQTLLGLNEISEYESYGPRLIGEPSAFGTGQYWAFVAAVSAARIKTGDRVVLNIGLFVTAITGAWLAESRVSVGSILVMLALILVLGRDRTRSLNIIGILTGIVVGLIGLTQILPELGGRLSPQAIQEGFLFRVENIWTPFFEIILTSPLIGIGPGGLLGEAYLSEAHNIVLRAMLDFGIVVGLIFIAMFIRVMIQGFRLARTADIDKATRIAGYIGAFCLLSTLLSGQVQDALTAVMSSHLTMIAVGILAAQRALYFDTTDYQFDTLQLDANAPYRVTNET